MNFEPFVAPIWATNANLVHAWNRRRWLASVIGLGCMAAYRIGPTRVHAGPVDRTAADNEVESFRVRSIMELNGEVRLKNQAVAIERRDGKQLVARTATVRSTSTLDYEEQYRLGADTTNDRCLQSFQEASSEITVDQHVTKTTLRDTSREIVKLATPTGMLSVAPANPMFAAERDLVEGSLTSMYLDQILTDKDVEISDQWDMDRSIACRLLNLDAIQEGKLTLRLVDVDAKQAHLTIQGRLTASVRSVATELVLEGKAVMDREGGFVSWLALRIDETREIGEAEPGFKITATLRVLRAPIDSLTSSRTLDEALGEIPSMESANMLQFQSDLGFYRFLADRRWSTYRDNGEEATLRFIVGNRRVAQCNIANLVDYEPGRQLSLEGYQSDVQRLISKSGHDILETSERLSGTSHRVLRIVTTGQVEGIPIRWIYYHISNDTGRRLSMTYTLDEASVELFADQDQQLAGSIELLAWPKKLDATALESQDTASVPDTQGEAGEGAKKTAAAKTSSAPRADTAGSSSRKR